LLTIAISIVTSLRNLSCNFLNTAVPFLIPVSSSWYSMEYFQYGKVPNDSVSILENDISHCGHQYLAPNFIVNNDENKPKIIPNRRLIKIE